MLVSQRLGSDLEVENDENVVHLKIQWHPTKDILGVSSSISAKGGFLSFFTKKGGKPFHSSAVRKNLFPEKISWHSNLSLLAVGWSSGLITLIDPIKKTDNEILHVNLEKICCLAWCNEESILLAIDVVGCVKTFKLVQRQSSNELVLFLQSNISDELATDVIVKRLNRNVFEQLSGNDKQQIGGRGAIGSSKAQKSLENESDVGEEQTFTKLLNKHRKFMEFEEQKSVLPLNTDINSFFVFFIATNKGGIYVFGATTGQLIRIFQADSEIYQLLSIPDQLYILAITEGMMFYQLSIEGRLANDKIKVKLSGHRERFAMIRIDTETIVFCYGEPEIRIWDLRNEDSAILPLSAEKGYDAVDRILSLSYSTKKDCISGVTESGKIAIWRRQNPSTTENESSILDRWRLQNSLQLNVDKIIEMSWSRASAALAVNTGRSVEIFVSQGVDFFVDLEYAVIQVNPQVLSLVRIVDPSESVELQLHANIKGFFISGNFLLLWDDAKVQLDQIIFTHDTPLSIQSISTFDINPNSVSKAIYYNNRILLIEKDRLLINTVQGTLKKSVVLREAEGVPKLLDVNGNWLCVATSNAYLLIYDFNDDKLKLTFHSTSMSIVVNGKWEKFDSVKMNSGGNRVSFTVQQNETILDKIFVWEAETDNVAFFSFRDGMTDQQQYEAGGSFAGTSQNSEDRTRPTTAARRPKTAAARKLELEINRYKMPNHIPSNHFWDRNDPRFLMCEANSVGLTDGENTSALVTMFATTEHGIQMHDLQWRPAKVYALISVSVPYIYFLKNSELDEEEDEPQVERSISRLILRRTLREFVGVDANDTKAIGAMLNFSFFLCIGQMDNAFKAIKYIKNESVWEHMAQMCVKTRRIDVARVCLGHMRNWRAARALNASITRGDSVDLQTARLALELNMIDEAKAFFLSMNRYDMLNEVHQAQGKWSEAFEIATKHDRIHLRHTHYNYARYLESVGAIESAIENYELANVHHFEVPRMLCDEPKALEFYIKRKSEPQLYKWWAQYLESLNELDTAKNFYILAVDYLSVVRILCYSNNVEEAIEVVNRTGDRAAAFHLANFFESNEQSRLAVQYFGKAGAYSTAIRLAMRYNMTDKLANFALMAGGGELVKVAQYYEDLPGHADKAVMLYHKAGMIGRALDLAFRTEQLSALDLIAQDLNENSDPRVLERASEFFAKNQQHRTAVQLLAYAKKFSEAVALCVKRKVIITDEMDQLLTPPKTDEIRNSDRVQLLEEIAKCCLQQGNYHFAAKKFTQAGNKIEAMRALLKSGDTQRIVLFANTARSKDIYKMVGNYLQTLNWKEDAQLMRQIESFYVKANALESLASFYEACAQVEIDDYRDYEKALAAYNEALRCLLKRDANPAASDDAISAVNGVGERRGSTALSARRNSRIHLEEKQEKLREFIEKIRGFVSAKQLYETNPGEALRLLTEMTEIPVMNEVVRLGDIFAIIILHNVKRNNFRKAYQIIESCMSRHPKIDMHRFLSKPIIEQIYAEVGVTLPHSSRVEEQEVGNEKGSVEYSHLLRRQMATQMEQLDGD